MKRLLSIKYSEGAFNFSMLLMRVSFGCMLLLKQGLPKLMNFTSLQYKFYNFMGMGPRISLTLVLFAEVFCSLFIILGLFTRITLIPLIITMLVVIFSYDKGKPLVESELAVLFLTGFITLLFCGPGKISVDGLINR